MQRHLLKHHSEFVQILGGYTMSDKAKETIAGLKLVLLVAPTGGGKNTIIRHLLETEGYYYIVSDTTRQPRVNDGVMEQNGREYWFRTEEEMLEDLKAGEYLEAELIHNQQVSGISVRELKKAKQEDKIAVTDVDPQGVHNVARVKSDTTVIMILPPTFEEWQRRLARRGHMSPHEQQRRLQTAYKVISDGLENNFYNFVISEHVGQSAAIIDSLAKGGHNPHQDRGRAVALDLKGRLQDKIGGFSQI